MLVTDLVETANAVAATRSRRRKVALLAELLRRLDPDEVALAAGYLAGEPRQPRLDVGWATLRPAADTAGASGPTLTVRGLDERFQALAEVRGAGSKARRAALLEELFRAATDPEQRWLTGLLLGDLRQGALAGVMVQAIAEAWDVPEATVRRAAMLGGDLAAVAAAAGEGGAPALDAFRLTLFRPLQPMLAQTAGDAVAALDGLGPAVVEHKLDGARVQVHREGARIGVYTRNLRDITARAREVLAVVSGLDVDSVVLDGEVLALRPDGVPHPFQDTMRRFGSERALAAARESLALTPYFFDCLHVDGEDLLDHPLGERLEALARVVPARHRPASRLATTAGDIDEMLADALDAGHEGVMVKASAAPYEAGRRGAAWRKLKPVHTLDLVVLAAEWGSGRRQGWLSNLHLGARGADGGFVMLGKTFKGLTDELLTWQTERLLELETGRDGHIVHVRPELVVEVAFDGVQTSSRYAGGVALRFARVKRYRPDKSPGDVDQFSTVQRLAAR